MSIEELISKNYDRLKTFASKCDKPIYCGLTQEDIFHNCLMYAMRKYSDIQLEEKEGLNMLRKLIATEIKYAYKRKKKDILVLTEDGNLQG